MAVEDGAVVTSAFLIWPYAGVEEPSVNVNVTDSTGRFYSADVPEKDFLEFLDKYDPQLELQPEPKPKENRRNRRA